MNHFLPVVRAARSSAAPDLALRSDLMLGELLSLHQETLAQLQLDRTSARDLVAFLDGMIAQHESAVRTLRTQLSEAKRKGNHDTGLTAPLCHSL